MDTNVLVRFIVRDDLTQAATAFSSLAESEEVIVTLSCLCELAWVLRSVYKLSRREIAAAIRVMLETENFQLNREAVEFGLSLLEAGGDFADGLIAFEGEVLGGETFVSFDKKAVGLLAAQGVRTRLL